MLIKSFVDNVIIDVPNNFSKYIQYKHVWKLFEVGYLHQNTVMALYRLDTNEKFLRILVTTVYFKDRNWISKIMYYISCLIVCEKVFCSESPDFPDNAGRKMRRKKWRRTQVIVKRYAFHANAKATKVE